MKKILLILSVLCSLSAMAQDVIVKQNGDEIQCKLIEVGTESIKYKRWSNQNGPTFVEERDDVFMIKYENGEKDVFGVKTASQQNNVAVNPSSAMRIPNLRYDKGSISGLYSGSTEIPLDYAQTIMGTDWSEFQMYQDKRKKGKNLLVWGIACNFLSTGAGIVGIATETFPLYIVGGGMRVSSYPLLAIGIVNFVKGQRGCKRLAKQHSSSSIGFNPEFDFKAGVNSMSLTMKF